MTDARSLASQISDLDYCHSPLELHHSALAVVSISDFVVRARITAHGQSHRQQDSIDPYAYDRNVYNSSIISFEWAQFVTRS